MAQFHATTPQWNSLGSSDDRAAWTGVWPGTSTPLRVEAAGWRGKPVFFRLISEWTEPERMVSAQNASGSKALEVVLVSFLLVMLAGAVWLARRNYQRQKSDPLGAFRLGLLIFALQMLAWLFSAHFVPSLDTIGLFVLDASGGVFLGSIFYIVYLAIEPYVRKHWPHAIISWTRLMSGRIRDPLVGRDILFGVILGVVWSIIIGLMLLGLKRIGAAPQFASTEFLFGPRYFAGTIFSHLTQSVQATLGFFFLMFVFRIIFRNPWLAALAFVTFWTFLKAYGEHHLYLMVPAFIAIYGIAAFVVLRFGFIALAVGIFSVDVMASAPVTTDISSWYIGGAICVPLLMAALAIWGCYTALAGQKLVGENLFE
jgi:hypothetical protein